MQVVIDISEEEYNYIKRQVAEGIDNPLKACIVNGTPLPKWHGRLIDADNLNTTTITTDDYSGNEVIDIVLKEDIDNANTIIEADNGES